MQNCKNQNMEIFKTLKLLGGFIFLVILTLLLLNIIFDAVFPISPTLKLVVYSLLSIIAIESGYIIYLSIRIGKYIKQKKSVNNSNLYSLIILTIIFIYSLISLFNFQIGLYF